MKRHLIALRWLPFSVLSAIFGLIAPLLWTDWSVARAAGRQLLSTDALTVYTDHPQAQMGPLALLVAGALPQPAYIVVTSLLLTVFLYVCEKSVPVGRRGSPQRVLFCVGIGGALLDHFIDQGREAGLARLHLEVRDGNPAVAMYQAFGFEEEGRRRKYYTGRDGSQHDALTMALKI